jgi:hypothetical protein
MRQIKKQKEVATNFDGQKQMSKKALLMKTYSLNQTGQQNENNFNHYFQTALEYFEYLVKLPLN